MSSLPIRRRRAPLIAVVLAFSLAAVSCADAAESADQAIRTVMDASAVAWTNGDLEAFMDSYEDSPDTVFVGAKGLVRGKAAIAARYATQFGAGGGPGRLGKLSFDVLEIRPLGPADALLIGRYHLQPEAATKPEASGIFSLIFHERGGQWRIVCDHTS